VYTIDENNKRVPLLHITEKNGVVYTKHVYKAINAWGDSFRAQEFYTTKQQSVLDNGFDKVNEVEDDVIVDIYKGGGATSTAAVAITSAESEGVPQEEINNTLNQKEDESKPCNE
jgi:hypothetical protein